MGEIFREYGGVASFLEFYVMVVGGYRKVIGRISFRRVLTWYREKVILLSSAVSVNVTKD